jgi:hypothetical protein
MKMQPISFLSGLIVANAAPVILNAASLPWNPSKIAKDYGIVILAEEIGKPAPKADRSQARKCPGIDVERPRPEDGRNRGQRYCRRNGVHVALETIGIPLERYVGV